MTKPPILVMNQVLIHGEIRLLHGKFLSIDEGEPQETERNFGWLISGELKITSEALIVAAQDQTLATRNIQAKLFHSADSPKRRQRGKKDKTLAHIISRCEMLANSNYLNCHNQIASQIHRALSGKYGFERLEQWWQHKVDTVNWKMKHPKIYGTSTCILTRPFTSAALTCTN